MDTMTVWHKEDTWRIKSLTGKMHYRGYIYVILELILSEKSTKRCIVKGKSDCSYVFR